LVSNGVFVTPDLQECLKDEDKKYESFPDEIRVMFDDVSQCQ